MYRGDRGLFWLGDPKLLFATASTPFGEHVCRRWGYPGTILLAPKNPTHQLSLDILREPELLKQVIDYAGPGKTLCMVPYATTAEFYQLIEILRTCHGLTICLPESPTPNLLWLRDHIDSKAGFRALAAECLHSTQLLPKGFACKDTCQAAEAVNWFLQRGEGCVVKADGGESGIGHVIFQPALVHGEDVRSVLDQNPFLRDDIIIVEQFIHATVDISPSLEMYVPSIEEGQPRITYVSRQCFTSFGRFSGVVVSRDLLNADWYPPLAKAGMAMAAHLQKLGYVGHFDLDAVVDDAGRLFLLETNARRTGGTYVHEFAQHTFGPDYLQDVALMSINALRCPGITCLDALLDWLDDLLYPIQSSRRGVVITVTSTLPTGEFGCILVADDEAGLTELQQKLIERLQIYPQGNEAA
jgi:hypothetical protein